MINKSEVTTAFTPMVTLRSCARGGWKNEEDDLLFSEVERAREEGRPLKDVFDRVALKTSRKPNSVRNYYYMRIKEDDERARCAGHCAAFVPFTDDEIYALLRTVLGEQAKGISVRACTLSLGGGDNKAMLRYQNKYRALIKSNSALVKKVIADMQQAGVPVFDPYGGMPRSRAGRPRKTPESLVDVVSGVVNDLLRVDGLDVTSFFENLGALAVGASRGAEAVKRLEAMENGNMDDVHELREKNSELMSHIAVQSSEIAAQRERFNMLLSMFRQLMNVNREFLCMTSVVKMSSLGNYIRELSRNVEDCERLMREYAN